MKLGLATTGQPVRLGQPTRYVIVASATFGLYFAVLATALALSVHYLVAILVAQMVTISMAFPAYRHWVFGPGHDLWRDFLRFLSVWAGGASAGLVLTPLLVELGSWSPLTVQVIVVLGVGVASFLGHKLISFRPVRENPVPAGTEPRY